MSESVKYVKYRTSDGACLGVSGFPVNSVPTLRATGVERIAVALGEQIDVTKVRVDLTGESPVLVDRDALPFSVSGSVVADGVDEAVITVPADTVAVLPDGARVDVADGTLELTFDVAGTHEIELSHELYLTTLAAVVASEA